MYLNFQNKTVVAFALSLCFCLLTSSFDTPAKSHKDTGEIRHSLNKIVIDAGHGGKDPGCLGSKVKEKDIALNIALVLGQRIQSEFPEIEVIYTRDSDVFVPLHERANIANRSGADLFISVHCNYVGKRNQAKGTETYIMGLHRAEDNLNVAKRENSSITLEDDYVANYDGYDPNSAEAHIILSMYQNAFLEQSIMLAQSIEDEFASVGRVSRGVKQAGFLVLRNTTMPSVLVETGFLSHDHDESFLSSSKGQSAIADGLFKAFTNYRSTMEALNEEQPTELATTQEIVNRGSIMFYVQLFASTQEPDLTVTPWNNYANLTTKKENNYYKYLAGPFQTVSEANKSLSVFGKDGLDNCFVVAYRGEERVQMEAISATGSN